MSSFLRNKLDITGSPTYTPVGNKTNHLPPVVRLGGDTPRGDGGREFIMGERMWGVYNKSAPGFKLLGGYPP